MDFKKIKKLIPEEVHLYYADTTSFDNDLGAIQQCIEEGTGEALDDVVMEYEESDFYGFDQVLDDLKTSIENDETFKGLDADSLMTEYEDEIRDTIYDRDRSDVMGDMLRNTSKQPMFYDLDYEVDGDTWNWTEEHIAEEVGRIKEVLGVPTSKHDSDISIMVQQATYGGSLVIYFYDDAEDYILDHMSFKPAKIKFGSPVIAIIDTCNGSGDDCCLGGVTVTVPFLKERITIDRTIKYNYTFEVCGMDADWCAGTEVTLVEGAAVDTPISEDGPTAIQCERELNRKYDIAYAAGECSYGDMDTRRHRNTFYQNTHICGTKCKDCGTFWVD